MKCEDCGCEMRLRQVPGRYGLTETAHTAAECIASLKQERDALRAQMKLLLHAASQPATCERCKFLAGELRALESKLGIENVFEQGVAQGRASAASRPAGMLLTGEMVVEVLCEPRVYDDCGSESLESINPKKLAGALNEKLRHP